MDNENPPFPQSECSSSQQSTKTKPQVEIHNLDVLEFQNTSDFVDTSTNDMSPTHFRQEIECINRTYDIQAEEYQALFSTPVTTNKSNKSFYSQDDISLSPSTGKTPKRDKEAVNELSLILVECMDRINTRSREVLLRKFYADVEREERLERFIVEKLRNSKVKAITELYEDIEEKGDNEVLTRCLFENRESSNKLERFKVRLLILEGES